MEFLWFQGSEPGRKLITSLMSCFRSFSNIQLNVSSIKHPQKKWIKTEIEILTSCSQGRTERNMSDEELAAPSWFYLFQMNNLKPQCQIILLILESKWKISLTQSLRSLFHIPHQK